MSINTNRDAHGHVLEDQQASSQGTKVASASLSIVSCLLRVIAGYNASGALAYVQLHDKATAIQAGDVPKIVIPVNASYGVFSLSLDWEFANGLQVGLSTTEATYTAASASLGYYARFATVAAAS